MKESEIRPKNLHDTIIDFSRQDVEKLILSKREELEKVSCPACGSKKASFQFQKFGLDYVLCEECRSLYLSPRPKDSFLNQIYPQMKSVQYWQEHFYRDTAEARREKVYAPRAKKIVDFIDKYEVPDREVIADIGSGYGIFLEELKKISDFKKLIAVEPTSSLAEVCESKGFEVIKKMAQDLIPSDLPESLSVMTCFEILEHLVNPLEFLNILGRFLKKGGLVILSAPSVSGIDVQLLWEKSKTIYPPHHINLLSVEGVKKLIERANGLELLEISTPGLLDVDIIRNAKKEGIIENFGRFFDYLFWRQDEKIFKDLQQFCQEHNLSSHLMVVIRKK